MTDPKKALRQAAAARRANAFDNVDPGAAQARLLTLLTQLDGPVSFYWPIRTEIDPRPVMEALVAEGKEVCLPMTHGRDAALSFRAWAPGMAMVKDGFQVDIPATDTPMVPMTLVVPMLAFDRHGHRLGYGAGHYDRTLDGLRSTAPRTAIGFAFAAQEAEADLPTLPTDEPLDGIVTELEHIVP